MLTAYANGFGTGAGLIIAIGAQNAFVLSQGIRKNHHLIIAAICSFFDALLVGIGVTGVGTALAKSPVLTMIAGAGGALFLFAYGGRAFYTAFKGGRLETRDNGILSLKTAVLTTLAVTLLNPHVYIDTVLLVGGIAAQFQAPGHLAFGAGAITASFAWFFVLSTGAGFLAPLFRKTISWRILDTLVGLVMWAVALSLAMGITA